MNDLSSAARDILNAGRDADGAGDLERARVRKALMAKIAAGGALSAAGTAAASTTTAAAAPTAKLLVALAVAVAGGVGGAIAWRTQRPEPAPVVAPALAPVVVAAPAPVVVPSAPVAVEAPAPRPAPVKRARPSAHAEAPANRLAEETALLAAANGELRNGDARRALGLLDDYDRRYPSGVLREEVLATRVIARCQIGLAPDATARRAANTFLTRHPASPLAPRVRSSCGR
jgi:hypothetical protein